MTKKILITSWLVALLGGLVPQGALGADAAPDVDTRRLEALQNIQDALDEDPEEAAKLLGSTPVENLDIDALETLSDQAGQFLQNRMLERQQDEREARARLQEYRDLQNSRR